MVAAITDAAINHWQGIRRQGGQGVVLDLTLKGDGILNASVPWFPVSLLVCSVDPLVSHNNSVYTVDITVGTPQVKFPILVDTGSSDFVRLLCFGATFDQSRPLTIELQWIASTSCGTSECKQSGQALWNPEASSTHRASNVNFQLAYLQGSVQGPVYWDTVTIGGYQIVNQAIGEC